MFTFDITMFTFDYNIYMLLPETISLLSTLSIDAGIY